MSNIKNLKERLDNISKKITPDLYPEFPKKNLLIEVTNNCNCNCLFCAHSKMQRNKSSIDPTLVKKILKEAYQLGTREVGFYTTGEPLLNKDLETYIAWAKAIGYNYTYITTNGILLNERRIKKLIDSGLDSIKLSINAINKKEYEFIHGIDKFDTVLTNLKKLYQYKIENKLNLKIYVSYIATKFTDHSISEIKEVFKNYCDEIAIVNVRNQSGMMPEIPELLSCQNKEEKIQAERNIPCHYVFNSVIVTKEGYLSACCTDFENYLAYADLNKTSLKEAWTNEIITSLREKHLTNKIENTLCYNCIYGNKTMPEPLQKELASKTNKEITDKVSNRLEEYLSLIK